MQTNLRFYSLLLPLLLLNSFLRASTPVLAEADSLYEAGRYREAFKNYQLIYNSVGFYTEKMLLRMAYITEARGEIAETLYYLNTYFKKTGKTEVLRKMEKLANDNDLQGYKYSDSAFFSGLYYQFKELLIPLFVASMILLFTLLFLKWRQRELNISVALLVSIVLLAIVAARITLSAQKAIVTTNEALAMDGPSPAATQLSVFKSGERVEVIGENDVWLKVHFNNKQAYIMKTQARLL